MVKIGAIFLQPSTPPGAGRSHPLRSKVKPKEISTYRISRLRKQLLLI
ncbi:hypothetical protein J2X19_000781 [Rhodoferax ferrireducens]|uniref:Uncharacterized protein n=1 Tax=Rhodoferax ferrireducens TaxID=192843 RepID=A0ABU2C470_9BURK|nr:hypothetical protein [Rhodoferax ferrireducens]